ncbi:FAD-dependent monooxygenase [Streptomyces sp. SID12501]|uniref:2-polyprenyl-6-methoxyphenol hydroxylase n=1 Tax=Streptomyces sp. SID12501 TaxID=2706042 RepID=A0A6B3BH44_9ACTN|nr:FAD-dependent monooxygenase [Streptomyces sp. SID12501]NEC85080.1 2-polyprenyl-6-methoxyphenol hydroxylase [Streptomyces sp. SID12501]
MTGQDTRTGAADSPEVLIVGAGPVGLTLAISLGQRGIRCLLVERSRSVGTLPKMDLCNPRSMEIFGRLGLAEKIRAAGWPLDARPDVYTGPSLAEPPYAVLSYPSIAETRERVATCADGTEARESYQRISQYTLEALLGQEARALPTVRVCFGHELTGFSQDADGVHAEIRSANGEKSTVIARYLVGCDGGGSLVRKTLGIEYSGRARVARNYQIFFRCPELLDKAGLEPFRHYYLAGARQGVLIAQDDLKRWSLHVHITADADVSRLDPAEEVRAALGLDLDPEVLHAGAWTPHLLVADQYRDGRVLLAGDSAHQYIPTGGFGLNTGIGDADNLAWKLTAVLRGWGGPTLLDSYHAERHPVGVRNCRAAEYAATGVETWRRLYDPVVGHDTPVGRERRRLLAAAFNTYQRRSHEQHGTELGYRYALSPVCSHETGPLPDPDSPVYQPSAAPGSRLPNAWIKPGASVHDQAGTGLTLLALDTPTLTTDRFLGAARQRGVPLDVLRLDGRGDLRQLYGASLLLLRPDLHVAWRGEDTDVSPDDVLDVCTGRRTRPDSPDTKA